MDHLTVEEDELIIPVPDLARDFWSRIAETFHAALNFDPQWYAENDHSITWWPNFLSQSIEAETFFMAGENPNTDITVRVTITTPVCLYTNQEWADTVCHGENTFIPYGAFVARDGLLKLTASAVISPLNFEMTQLLHEMALVHIASATKLAYYLTDTNTEGVTIATSEHPESGSRAIPDELARLFLSDHLSRSQLFDDEMEQAIRESLPFVKAWFLDNGYSSGWEGNDVFFVDHPHLNWGIGIGFPLVKEFPERYGPGLQIMSTILHGVPEPEIRDWCNDLNLRVLDEQNSSQLGPIYGVLDSGDIYIRCYLGAFFLRKRLDSSHEALVVAATNAMIHMVATVMRLSDEIGIAPKPHK
jgi:hypothetical protein